MVRAETLELWYRLMTSLHNGEQGGEADYLRKIRRAAAALQREAVTDDADMAIYTAAIDLERAGKGEVSNCLGKLVSVMVERLAAAGDPSGIMVVSNDDATRAAIESSMDLSMRHFHHATGAVEAQAQLNHQQFALIILDMDLPDDGCPETLVCIRESEKSADVPVFVVLDSNAEWSRAECLALGADGFIERPLNPGRVALEVAGAIAHALSLRRNRRRDMLTGLPNRAAIEESFTGLSAQAVRTCSPWSVGVIDVDKLAKLNESSGRSMGDIALLEIGKTVRNNARASDVVGRWRGDEFVVLMPDTPVEGAWIAMERFRQKLHKGERENIPRFAFSASVVRGEHEMKLEEAITKADRFVTRAKAAGGDRVFTITDG